MSAPGSGGAEPAAAGPDSNLAEANRAAADAAIACALLAIDPMGLGGAVLRGLPGPGVDAWLETLHTLLPADRPWRRLPVNIDDDRLLGGLDVSASLASGRPVLATGLLAEADGGVIVMPMAERFLRGVAARLSAALDRQAVVVERDGMTRILPARFCLVALDEGLDDAERISPDLADRLALHLDVAALRPAAMRSALPPASLVRKARRRCPGVEVPDELLASLCGAAVMLGIDSMRAPNFALRVIRAHAALAGRNVAGDEDLAAAARLVYAPRATQFPVDEEESAESPPPPPQEEERDEDPASPPERSQEPEPGELVVEAVRASLPPDLLTRLQTESLRRRGVSGGRRGPRMGARRRGRPIGVRRGKPVMGQRLHVPSTLKAAAPWQKLRRGAAPGDGLPAPLLAVRGEDFRIVRYKARRQTVHVFVVDASGSSAVHRLAEAKGAIELLLAESYVRRDQVALIAFRGEGAETLLSPTRALARARRELAALPGGGATPLAAGLDAAVDLALDIERRGQQPLVVVLTDGRANVARDGVQGHGPGAEDALAAARRLASCGWPSLLVDTSRRPRARARELAEAMRGEYLPLPQASAASLCGAVRAVGGS